MSDARAEYESAVDSATADLARETTIAYQKMRAACGVAWYTYCVRSGMVSVPTSEGSNDGTRGESLATGLDGDGHGDSDGESAPGADDSPGSGEGTKGVPEPGAADEEASPDSR